MTETLIPVHAIKGRGLSIRMAHRFSVDERAAFDDGWGTLQDDENEAATRLPVPTQVTFEDAKSAITHNDSPDIYFDYGLNPYRAANMVVFIAMRGLRTVTLAFRQGWILKAKSSPNATWPAS